MLANLSFHFHSSSRRGNSPAFATLLDGAADADTGQTRNQAVPRRLPAPAVPFTARRRVVLRRLLLVLHGRLAASVPAVVLPATTTSPRRSVLPAGRRVAVLGLLRGR